MEQIYTIPVTEAFTACLEDAACGCPFCRLYDKLEEDELSIVLGASMMEPDIRIRTNAEGFCPSHYRKMFVRQRKLGLGLILESHLQQVRASMGRHAKDLLMKPGATEAAFLEGLEKSCYVCGRIERSLSAMTATAVYLWQTNPDFRKTFVGQPYFCLPHYRRMVTYASKKLSKRDYAAFFADASAIEERYAEKLQGDVSWFCKKFDYSYQDEPWYDAKDSIERAISFLGGGSPQSVK